MNSSSLYAWLGFSWLKPNRAPRQGFDSDQGLGISSLGQLGYASISNIGNCVAASVNAVLMAGKSVKKTAENAAVETQKIGSVAVNAVFTSGENVKKAAENAAVATQKIGDAAEELGRAGTELRNTLQTVQESNCKIARSLSTTLCAATAIAGLGLFWHADRMLEKNRVCKIQTGLGLAIASVAGVSWLYRVGKGALSQKNPAPSKDDILPQLKGEELTSSQSIELITRFSNVSIFYQYFECTVLRSLEQILSELRENLSLQDRCPRDKEFVVLAKNASSLLKEAKKKYDNGVEALENKFNSLVQRAHHLELIFSQDSQS